MQHVYDLKMVLMGKVIYASIETVDDESSPGQIGFVKRKQFSPEKEVRFLWLPNEVKMTIKPQVFRCPAVRAMCRRIS